MPQCQRAPPYTFHRGRVRPTEIASSPPLHPAAAGAPERDWGLRPARLAGVGQQEDAWQFFGSVCKYLRRYLQLLAEEGQLELLRAAGAAAAGDGGWLPPYLPPIAKA